MAQSNPHPFHITTLMFVCLVIRRCYPLMLVLRFFYRRSSSNRFRKAITSLFDPNSIRRHSHFSIPTKYVCVRGSLGEQMRVNIGDHIGWMIFLNGYFDLAPSLIALALHVDRPNATYLDVGANIGDTSVGLAHRGINTVGIDASPMAIAELCHNITLNSPIPYTVVHAAVSATPAKFNGDVENDYIKIHVPIGNTGAASVHAGWNQAKDSNVAMLAAPRTIDQIVDSLAISSLSLIKLDVEGAEHDAIFGMQDLLQRHRVPIVFEYRIDHIDEIGMEQKCIVDLLPDGYRCFAVSGEWEGTANAKLRISDFDRKQSHENVLGVYETLPACLEAAFTTNGLVVDVT